MNSRFVKPLNRTIVCQELTSCALKQKIVLYTRAKRREVLKVYVRSLLHKIFSNLGAQKYHFMCFPQDIFRNTKKNAIVSILFYISSVIDKVCTVFTEKRVKQDKKRK